MAKEKKVKETRTIMNEQLDKPVDFVTFIMNDFLTKNAYKQKEIKGEQVWQAGVGMLEMPKFLKYSYVDGVFHLEAWVKTAWLPGVYGKDQSLDGFTAAVPKQGYKKELQALITVLQQPIPDNNYTMLDENGNAVNSPIQVQCIDNSKKAVSGFICSLAGLVFAIMGGWLAIVLGAIAIVNGKKSMTSSKKGLGTAAFVIGIIDLVIFVVMVLVGILLVAAVA